MFRIFLFLFSKWRGWVLSSADLNEILQKSTGNAFRLLFCFYKQPNHVDQTHNDDDKGKLGKPRFLFLFENMSAKAGYFTYPFRKISLITVMMMTNTIVMIIIVKNTIVMKMLMKTTTIMTRKLAKPGAKIRPPYLYFASFIIFRCKTICGSSYQTFWIWVALPTKWQTLKFDLFFSRASPNLFAWNKRINGLGCSQN